MPHNSEYPWTWKVRRVHGMRAESAAEPWIGWYAMTLLLRPPRHVTNQKRRDEWCWKPRTGAFLDRAKYNIALGCDSCLHNPATAGCLTEHGWFEVTSLAVLIRSKRVLIFLFFSYLWPAHPWNHCGPMLQSFQLHKKQRTLVRWHGRTHMARCPN